MLSQITASLIGLQRLMDPYGRPLEGLRVSVNAECNFKCIFCHMEGVSSNNKMLTAREYEIIAEAFRQLGGKEVKITGGEPLLRNDIIDIVRAFTSKELRTSLTTNGFLLEKYSEELKQAGIHHINVSLHALDKHIFKSITGGILDTVLQGITAALRNGIRIKLNYVALKENEKEFPKILNYAGEIGADINIIQLMPIFSFPSNGHNKIRIDLSRWRVLDSSIENIEQYLKKASVKAYYKTPHNRRVYKLPNGVTATVIRGYDNPFACYNCTRIRITPDAKVKTCLYAETPYVDLKEALKKRNVNMVKVLLAQAVSLRKPRFLPKNVHALSRKVDWRVG